MGRFQVAMNRVRRMIMPIMGLLLIAAMAVKYGEIIISEGEREAGQWIIGEEEAGIPAMLGTLRQWTVSRLADMIYHEYPGTVYEREAAGSELSWQYCLERWIYGNDPRIRYAAQKAIAADVYTDPDPSYRQYLERARIIEESGFLLSAGSEETGAHELELAGSYEGTEQPVDSLSQLVQSTPAHHQRQSLPILGTRYVLEQLKDYDFLMKHFYSVHSSTTAGRDEMDAEKLLSQDLSIEKKPEEPQILIYHTHSQEMFADYGPDNPDATVFGIGQYLTQLLQEKGYNVIHDTDVYDLVNGELDRSKAYDYALDGVTRYLEQYPSIEVILDIHRDGVREDLHMVSEVGGKPTAPIMFFNGMSQTPEGPIEYLKNPYKEQNLAFSLQMQLDAAAYFPGLTRKIYLKGFRYNLHLRPRSALIEVGAQTNTYEEARNAMEPLAELLDLVLDPQG